MHTEDWFWSNVNKQGPFPHKKACEEYPEIAGTRCWEWTGKLTNSGYGRISFQGKRQFVHRLAWTLSKRKIRKHKPFILHKCDNKKCVRHLFDGTCQDNILDRDNKGRQSRGKKHSKAMLSRIFEHKGPKPKLTNRQKLKIKERYIKGGYTYQTLAEKYNVSMMTIWHAVNTKVFT